MRALRAAGIMVAVLLPLLGVWAASSLAAYRNGPLWLVCMCGLLLFPVLPGLWEARAQWKRRRAESPRPRRLRLLTRLALRTAGINLAFLTALLWIYPGQTFVAVNMRGDWMLLGSNAGAAQTARRGIFGVAGALQWLYELTAEPNPHLAKGDLPTAPAPNPAGALTPGADGKIRVGDAPPWPMPATLHPAVVAMTRAQETSIEAVGRHLARQERDPFLLVKALHDWVADRIYYNYPALADESWRGKQTPERVFRRRKGVCSGYSRLLAAMGKAAGAEVYWVGGKVRGRDGSLEGNNHSWNLARIRGRWYLMDVTWNSPRGIGRQRTRAYRTTYLFTPPELFILRHFPKKPGWQLLARPLARGQMLRQPLLTPRFFHQGFTLLEPRSNQVNVDVGHPVTVRLRNPGGLEVSASLRTEGGEGVGSCEVVQGADVRAMCTSPGPGRLRLKLRYRDPDSRRRWYIGEVEVLVR